MRSLVNSKDWPNSVPTARARFSIVALSFLLYWVAFFLLYPTNGLPITTLGIIPLIIAAWNYGMVVGIFVTIALYIIEAWLTTLLGWGSVAPFLQPDSLLGLATSGIVSLIVGRLSERAHRSRHELEKNKILMDERNKAARFLNLLNDILMAAIETDDMASMLNVLALRTGELFQTDNCYITFWQESNRRTIPMAAYGKSAEVFYKHASRFEPDEQTLTAAVMEKGHAIAIEDTKVPSPYISPAVAESYSSRSMLGLPLIAGERNLGALTLAFLDFHHFSKEEIERGEMAARQISLAVTKAILLEEAQHSVHELVGLHDISQAFSLHGDAHKTYGLLAETVATLMGAKVCAISLYNPATNELVTQSPAFGLEGKNIPPMPYSTEGLETGWNFASEGTLLINSVSSLTGNFVPLAQDLDIECVVGAPLWDNDRHMLGVLFAANKPGGFNQEDARLLEVFARQVTVVLQNIHLLHTERTLAEKLAVLYAIAMATTQAANEDQLIEHVTLIIGQRLYSDSFGILLMDATTHELYLHSSYRIGTHEGLSRVPLGVGVTGSVARSGKPYRVDDVTASPNHLSLYPLTRSELCVPLKVEDKLLGVVNAESTKVGAFTTEDEELLTIIAGQLATAIQRLRTVQAEHYQTQQLERSNSLIRALSQVNTRAATAADLMGILTTLGMELNKLGLRCAVALLDPDNHHVILRYISLAPNLIKGMERIGKLKLENFSIPLPGDLGSDGPLPTATLVKDPLTLLGTWVPQFTPKTAKKVLKLVSVTENTYICDLPLINEGKFMGTLWMWGEGLHESDLPTVSLFASQVATALQKANLLMEVGRLAVTDELTGLFNRRHFFDLAEKQFALAARSSHPLSAMIIDLDHFKLVNDTYGHGVGDEVLRETARRMGMAMRESDIVGRYGGEEFSILLPDTTTKAAVYVAERLISQVSDLPMQTEAGPLTVHLSLGVAGMSSETPDLHTLIVRADQAMYLAKRAGRNCVAVK